MTKTHGGYISFPKDTPLPTHSQPHPPPTSTSTSTTLNLSVLQRYLPTITSIISIAAYTAIYTFQPNLSAWEKSGIEGTLFVVSILTFTDPLHPHQTQREGYALIVLNRRGLDNLTLYLHAEQDIEISDDFVIVDDRASREGKTWGLWIFEEEGGSTSGSRERVGGVIGECVRKMEERASAEGKGYKAEDGGGGAELMRMLNGNGNRNGGVGMQGEKGQEREKGQALLDLFKKP